ncbi:hypothetical protein L218DRAFT_912775 [Marasmius fiardii PR-910]|nr:hypothetical protein L218DRAFT_912775 [Marasmius fiardii PR-910]
MSIHDQDPESNISTLLCPTCNASFVPIPTFPAVDQDQLRANIVPSSTVKSDMCEVLEKERHQLSLYDEELDRLDRIVKKLRRERDCLAGRIRERESWSAPIRRVPVEILVEIFLTLHSTWKRTLKIFRKETDDPAEEDIFTEKYGSQSGNEAYVSSPPLALAQVSHHWRKVAVSCRRLWSSIDVDVGQPPSAFKSLISTYFWNSADHPLEIRIKGPDKRNGTGDYIAVRLGENGVTILRAMLSQSRRIKTLSFSDFSLHRGLPNSFYTPHPYSFPVLQMFESDTELSNPYLWLAKALKEAPLLKSVSAGFGPRVFPLPYRQLTSLKMLDVSTVKHFNFLSPQCPNLHTLEVTRYDNIHPEEYDPSFYDTKPIELPSVQYFAFEALYVPSSYLEGGLPPHLKFPNLHDFKLNYIGQDFVGDEPLVLECEWPCPGSRSLLRSCSSTLRRLSISFCRHALAGLAARHLLELSPTGLTHLDIRLDQDVDDFTETLLSALIISDTSSIVVPNLTSLSVTIVQGKPLVTEKIAKLIVDMVSSRRRRDLVERDDLAGRTSALVNAVFDFRYLLTDQSETAHRTQGDKDSRFLEIVSSAQLDSEMTLQG